MKNCQFCFQDDLDDRATKCPHCGAWVDGEERRDREFDALRRELQKEQREHRKDYQDYMKSIFNRVQSAAGIILVLVVGASTWFGFRTDESITDIKKEIISRVESELNAQKTQDLMAAKITAAIKIMEPGIAANAESAAKQAVELKAKDALADVNATIVRAEQVVGKTEARAIQTLANIESLDKEQAQVRERLKHIEKTARSTNDAILNAARAPVEKVALPVKPITMSQKEGVGEIPRLMERRPEALGFDISRSGYYGPAIWMYLDNLVRVSGFHYVVIAANRSFFGIFDAFALVSALNPPDTRELTKKYPLSSHDIPLEQEVPNWSKFADLLNDGGATARKKLISLPGFISGKEAVIPQSDKRLVLQRMEALGVDWLPVVDKSGGRFVGVINRSRLTSSLLLEIASGVVSPQ